MLLVADDNIAHRRPDGIIVCPLSALEPWCSFANTARFDDAYRIRHAIGTSSTINSVKKTPRKRLCRTT